MITAIIIFLVPFMTVAFLPLALKTISANDLDEMGIYLEDLDTTLSSCPVQRLDYVLPGATAVHCNAQVTDNSLRLSLTVHLTILSGWTVKTLP